MADQTRRIGNPGDVVKLKREARHTEKMARRMDRAMCFFCFRSGSDSGKNASRNSGSPWILLDLQNFKLHI
jgi:hypothetical protein